MWSRCSYRYKTLPSGAWSPTSVEVNRYTYQGNKDPWLDHSPARLFMSDTEYELQASSAPQLPVTRFKDTLHDLHDRCRPHLSKSALNVDSVTANRG